MRRLFATIGLTLLTSGAAAGAAGAQGGSAGSWLAGDMHVHSCYSHDAYCPPDDDNTGPDTIYSNSGTVGERFAEAAVKGLDFLAISDHSDIRAWRDPDFGSHGVLGLHGYEQSLAGGHAHVVGVERAYAPGPSATHRQAADSARALADAIDADGGLFQADHPSYRIGALPSSCADAELARWDENKMHWKYGFDVVPDSIEVWNPTALLAPAELYWECWLQRGEHVAATAGSDTHGALAQVGTPTTWVFARSRSERGVIAAIKSGRTTLSRLSPALGGLRLILEGDGAQPGDWDAMVGDTLAPGSKMRVRADGLPAAGLVTVRANGRTIVDSQRLAPGGAIEFRAPAQAGWVRATLSLPVSLMQSDPGCSPNPSPISLCSHDYATAALTSPVYVGEPEEAKPPAPPIPVTPAPPPSRGDNPAPAAGRDDDHKPGEAPMSPVAQSRGSGSLPPRAVPRPRAVPVRVRIARTRRGCRAVWSPAGRRFDVQERIRGRWRIRGRSTRATQVALRSCRNAVRVREVAGSGRRGRWVTARARVR